MLKRWWNQLIAIGIDGQTPAPETRQIVFMNAVVLLVLVLVVQNLGLGLAYRAPPLLTLVFVAHGLFIGVVLLWNKLKLYLLARVWWAVFATIFLSAYQVLMGTDSRWDVFLVVCVFVQCLTFPASVVPVEGSRGGHDARQRAEGLRGVSVLSTPGFAGRIGCPMHVQGMFCRLADSLDVLHFLCAG